MDRQRIYLDTSVISHLLHEDAPERMNDTLAFWEDLRAGRYEVMISEITMNELDRCGEPKRTELLNRLKELDYTFFPDTNEAEALANAYIEGGVLTRKSEDDCLHIATAVISGCSIIVSWNFKHMVKIKTIMGIRPINAARGYLNSLEIVTPTMMLSEEDE